MTDVEVKTGQMLFLRVEKDFKAIPGKEITKVLKKNKIGGNRAAAAWLCETDRSERYRLRQGRYRILYSVQDVVLTVWA